MDLQNQNEEPKLNLVQLRPTETPEETSKWDFQVERGGQSTWVRLLIEPCGCGVHAQWYIDVPATMGLPPELRAFLSGMNAELAGPKTVKKIVDEWHYDEVPKWKRKFFGFYFTLDRELIKWVKTSRESMKGHYDRRVKDMDRLKAVLET